MHAPKLINESSIYTYVIFSVSRVFKYFLCHKMEQKMTRGVAELSEANREFIDDTSRCNFPSFLYGKSPEVTDNQTKFTTDSR